MAESHELDWWLLEHPEHAGSNGWSQTSTGSTETVRRCGPDSDPAGFEWIDANDAAETCFSFLRWGSDGSVLACLANFSAVPHEGYRVGLPHTGEWTESSTPTPPTTAVPASATSDGPNRGRQLARPAQLRHSAPAALGTCGCVKSQPTSMRKGGATASRLVLADDWPPEWIRPEERLDPVARRARWPGRNGPWRLAGRTGRRSRRAPAAGPGLGRAHRR